LSFEDKELTNFLIKNAPYLVVDNAETARAILSTLIGGILSLMVFSFSMVMVLLNQASSNFSPRLLPGLISEKNNQFVLGFYLGTIVYNIIVLISILPNGNEYTLNGLSILTGIVFGVSCLGMFVFFIHTISTNIQINNILDKIYVTTKIRLENLIKEERQETKILDVDKGNWDSIKCDIAGYFQGVNIKGMLSEAAELKVNIKVLPYKGKYLLPNMDILLVDEKLNSAQIASLTEYLIFSNTHDGNNNYVLGIKQITEVGVKAMSPGINDPGTAIMTLDYLTELLALRMQLDDFEVYVDDSNEYAVQLHTVDFKDLVYTCLAEYRQYCKHDIILMQKMILLINYLKQQTSKNEEYFKILDNQLIILKEDIENSIKNSADLKKLKMLLED
jgi:uncharacterized membrane protein